MNPPLFVTNNMETNWKKQNNNLLWTTGFIILHIGILCDSRPTDSQLNLGRDFN